MERKNEFTVRFFFLLEVVVNSVFGLFSKESSARLWTNPAAVGVRSYTAFFFFEHPKFTEGDGYTAFFFFEHPKFTEGEKFGAPLFRKMNI
jgi:hypothetical protein